MHLPCHEFGKYLHCENVDTIYLPWEDQILLKISYLNLDIFFSNFIYVTMITILHPLCF